MPKKAFPKFTKPTTKKPAIQRKSMKKRGSNSSEDDAAYKTAGHLKKEDYLVIIKWRKIKHRITIAALEQGRLLLWSSRKICFGTVTAAEQVLFAVKSLKSIPLKDQPNPTSDEGLIQYLQRQLQKSTHQIHIHSTIDEKLEIMCPHYHAINKLMGGQAFVNPWFKVDAQAEKQSGNIITF
ncbi:hypothetical protein VP01_7956g1 [Puccinia sorghi]|uniref:Uncharacterized protein n=1 Tax=Puccinia sorghi TaxID=27349 RepID=A0A0L6UCT6_9BASI|nr:hypothetical protein VP01_7956g1 [Puccinia sorghi]